MDWHESDIRNVVEASRKGHPTVPWEAMGDHHEDPGNFLNRKRSEIYLREFWGDSFYL